jgi:hypothetical protein
MLRMLRVTMLWVLLLPYLLLYTGASFNQVAIISNGDCMPVLINPVKLREWRAPGMPEGMIDNRHCVMNSATHFKLLSDIIDLKGLIASVGDLLIWLSMLLMPFTPYVWGALIVYKFRKGQLVP